MEFIIDTVDLEEIKEAVAYMPIVGVTSNPSSFYCQEDKPRGFLCTYASNQRYYWKG